MVNQNTLRTCGSLLKKTNGIYATNTVLKTTDVMGNVMGSALNNASSKLVYVKRWLLHCLGRSKLHQGRSYTQYGLHSSLVRAHS